MKFSYSYQHCHHKSLPYFPVHESSDNTKYTVMCSRSSYYATFFAGHGGLMITRPTGVHEIQISPLTVDSLCLSQKPLRYIQPWHSSA